jgi:signal transduction histidine kinase/HAMP domain-containing protein
LVGIPRDVALAEVSRQRTQNVIGLLLIGLGALLVVWIGGDALILRPVRALIAATRRLGAGDLTARAMLARARGELGELALAFDDMAASVEQHSTARSEAEAHVRRVNRALRVLSECNKALVRATEEQALLEAICRVVVNLGGYRFAWVGFKEDHEAKTVRPVAHAGHDDGHRASLNVTWADDESRHGAVGTAVGTGQPSIVNDVSTDPAAVLWRADAVRWGYAAVVALPLLDGSRPFGALAIYAAEPNAFAAEEVDLLTELANDLAYGIVAWRTRAELDRQQEARHQSDKLATMGEMLAGVAHELNNPLTVVSGRAALLRAELGGGPLEGHVTKIDQAAQRCARIVRNFLALARQHPPERQEVQLNQIVREAVELLAYPLRVDNVEVRFELAEDLPSLWADSHQLHQVVVNLVTNADHAMRTSDAPRRLTLTTLFHAAEARALLRVIDTGPGIPPTIRARIFEPFFTTKPPGQGTGLGLSLCQGLVESHGGRIHVESEPGHGAVFTIELPVVTPAEEQRAVKVLPGGPRISGKAILIVDDEADVGELLADLLGRDRNQIDIVGDGGAALARIGERSYDLIVSDIRMPGLDGPEFYEALEQRAPQLLRRFVFITGDTLNTDIRAFLERTRAATLMKPLDFDAVQRMIGAVLETP